MKHHYPVMDERGRRAVFFTKDAQVEFMAGNPLRRRLTPNEAAKFWYRDRVGSAGRLVRK